ncbi:UDP-N-acetylmuramoyl-tripeptide--D-alanyl-D-alanine ligase [Sedimentibacter sp. MB31-C6]|uniref:UDP-N-acetylmuramoyl-tripeptide--D-alanyl-D- alanine ligase n=1 Tax=Sedimentibacter sp. MB31-C6 TaxID=3109366 RepID=UPI002DDCB511|nr:UDP-N-acetylmuramoyl-tripeptide--D-alanyl-D-alanine ligase [Sedimentibacter sp. MB36-C1]WSI04095.1 UDP-N-acetylmuramoyl-tripeptide--D-alanyl-D-alanine ligase [Sedimentibacter sp. MB36-C1]
MKIVILLFVVFWMILCALKLKYSLHMIQLVGYKSNKYIEWINNNKNKIHTKYDKIYISNLIIFSVFLLFKYSSEYIFGYSLMYLINIIILLVINVWLEFWSKYDVKKPLVFTGRAKRLFGITLLLVLIDLISTTILVLLITKNLILYFILFAGLLSIIYYFSSYYIIAANYIAKPIENKINNKFYSAASRKIREMKNITSIGITGSYGKTSTKFITATILNEKYKVLNTPESYNTPMGISKVINNDLNGEYDIFIAELGATQIGDIKEVAELSNPTIGIITSIGPCHLETFKSIDNIMRTKYELIEELPDNGIAIFNYDNDYVKKLGDKTFKEKILYGIDNIEDTDVFATDIKVSNKGSTFTLCVSGLGNIECKTKLLGRHNILNILAGVATAKVLGLSLEEISKGISKIKNIEHRLQLIDPGTGVIVIDDAFNSNPDGAKTALEVIDSFNDKRKIIVTPGMVELGEVEELENEKFGESIAKICDIAILIGERRTKPIFKGLQKHDFNMSNLYVVNSLDEASKVLKSLTKFNDVVLFENDLPDTYNEV